MARSVPDAPHVGACDECGDTTLLTTRGMCFDCDEHQAETEALRDLLEVATQHVGRLHPGSPWGQALATIQYETRETLGKREED